ncbi:hypothetical protein PGT21_028379 [Puccinia graminis f. sp. tritici]|uniref:CCHC-type domain-containing protein n=1 Tax=Puccinia graminis f. sp. tritici TaxID=56615 RepID=A0A5B0NH58_PUCGR|nr:hypothetical protein PGT21_028379 [Puccinia graminis f. sp. tritici]
MSLPYTVPDLEDGFAPTTPLGNRPFALGSNSNWNTGFTAPPPPMKKDKGKMPANQYREPQAEEEMSDSEDPTPQRQAKQTEPPVTGYGLHNARGSDGEPAERRYGPRIIKEPGLVYDGTNFTQFLARYERAALAFQASDYKKALQIGRFVHKEELKLELEAMEGYDSFNWTELRKAMKESWGELDNTILYTTADLVKIVEEYSRKGGLKDYKEYKAYLGKFTTILKYLVDNEHLNKKQDTSLLFISAFSKESQKNIKRTLVSNGKLPKGPDGSSKPPLWKHVTEAADTEIRVEEEGYFAVSGFSEANKRMQRELDQKKGDGQLREQMISGAPTGKVVEKQVEDIMQEMASLKQQLKSVLPVYNQQSNPKSEFSRGNAKPSTPIYEPMMCFYCHREGHTTYRCSELFKDEEQGLVKRNGKDWYLPDGQHIPWNPSRPIQTVVATASADPKMQEHTNNATKTEPKQNSGIMKSSAQTIDWDPPTLGAENFLGTHAITRSDAQKGRRSVRIQEPTNDEQMDVDQEEEVAEISPNPPKKPVEKVWSKDRISATKSKDASPEEILLQELDNVKIPTTFAQLTAISPAYTSQIISKLQSRLPEKSSTTYIATEAVKMSAMELNNEEEERDPCYYSCALGYVTAEIGGSKVDFMVDSGSMVNVIPSIVAQDLELEVVKVDIPMKGVGGARCDLNGVAENCPNIKKPVKL